MTRHCIFEQSIIRNTWMKAEMYWMIASAMSGLNQDSTKMYTMIAEQKKQVLVELEAKLSQHCELRIHLPAMPPF